MNGKQTKPQTKSAARTRVDRDKPMSSDGRVLPVEVNADTASAAAERAMALFRLAVRLQDSVRVNLRRWCANVLHNSTATAHRQHEVHVPLSEVHGLVVGAPPVQQEAQVELVHQALAAAGFEPALRSSSGLSGYPLNPTCSPLAARSRCGWRAGAYCCSWRGSTHGHRARRVRRANQRAAALARVSGATPCGEHTILEANAAGQACSDIYI